MTNSLRRIFRTLAPVLFICASTHIAARAQEQQPRAYKINEIEYTRCNLSEIPQVTDAPMPIFVELEKHTDAKAAVVVYASRPGEALSYARHVTRWLAMSRSITVERLIEVYGGFSEQKRLELWVVPARAEPPPSAPALTRVGVTLFDSYNYWAGEDCNYQRSVALEVFADTLKRMPGWRGTIVVRPHLNRRGLKPNEEGWDDAQMNRSQALRQAAVDKIALVRLFGLDASRVRAVVGARSDRDWSHAELWLIPPAPSLANVGR